MLRAAVIILLTLSNPRSFAKWPAKPILSLSSESFHSRHSQFHHLPHDDTVYNLTFIASV
jgi:hypothetical protein